MENAVLQEKIKNLKTAKNAVLLAHFYQEPAIQEIADVVGDSLELARAAQKTNAGRIVFAGVHFMAEGAHILNPSKKVLIPDMRAGCSLADSCPPEAFQKFRNENPDHFVVSYINCSAAIKAQSDVICTSSNAEKIISKIPRDRKILFAPDRNLGAYLIKKLDRNMTLWQGTCIVHETFSERKLIELQALHPEALLIAHPECDPWLIERADFVGSTSQLLKFTQENPATSFIVATESGILHPMKLKSPQKEFIPAPPTHSCACNDCPFMKLNTLEKIAYCLENDSPSVSLDPSLRQRAEKPLLKMMEWSA